MICTPANSCSVQLALNSWQPGDSRIPFSSRGSETSAGVPGRSFPRRSRRGCDVTPVAWAPGRYRTGACSAGMAGTAGSAGTARFNYLPIDAVVSAAAMRPGRAPSRGAMLGALRRPACGTDCTVSHAAGSKLPAWSADINAARSLAGSLAGSFADNLNNAARSLLPNAGSILPARPAVTPAPAVGRPRRQGNL